MTRMKFTSFELSKFSVLLSPSLVDRMRMFRSCGDLTAAVAVGDDDDDDDGTDHDTQGEPINFHRYFITI